MMNEADCSEALSSPVIDQFQWGLIKVENKLEGKDLKLYPGGAELWDWKLSNTHHDPGIQLVDVKDLIDKGAKIIILSKGMRNQLQVARETEELLSEQKKKGLLEFHIQTSVEAVQHYNQLARNKKAVGALIHSTC